MCLYPPGVVGGGQGRWSTIYMGNYLQQESPPPAGVPIGRQARLERVQTDRIVNLVKSLVMSGDVIRTDRVISNI